MESYGQAAAGGWEATGASTPKNKLLQHIFWIQKLMMWRVENKTQKLYDNSDGLGGRRRQLTIQVRRYVVVDVMCGEGEYGALWW
jgi:hypothetical protein